MTATETPVDNGVNVEALLDAREALTAAPEAANFTMLDTREREPLSFGLLTTGGCCGGESACTPDSVPVLSAR